MSEPLTVTTGSGSMSSGGTLESPAPATPHEWYVHIKVKQLESLVLACAKKYVTQEQANAFRTDLEEVLGAMFVDNEQRDKIELLEKELKTLKSKYDEHFDPPPFRYGVFRKWKEIVAELEQKVDGLEAKVDALDKRLGGAQQEIDILKSENKQLRTENARIMAENARVMAENAQLKVENKSLRDTLTLVLERLDKLEGVK